MKKIILITGFCMLIGMPIYAAKPSVHRLCADLIKEKVQDANSVRLLSYLPGRGMPLDVRKTNANCGPSSLAAYLAISSQAAIRLAPIWKNKTWISIKPMLKALEDYGYPHESINVSRDRTSDVVKVFGKRAGLALIQFTGPWDGHWSQEYAHTHWIVYDSGWIYDFNVEWDDGTLGAWQETDEWMGDTVPKIQPKRTTGFYVKNIIIPRQ